VPTLGDGSAMMLYSARTEQDFEVRSYGDQRRLPVDYEGLTLIRLLHEPARAYFDSRKS
jgi:CRISPR-associated protein Cas2